MLLFPPIIYMIFGSVEFAYAVYAKRKAYDAVDSATLAAGYNLLTAGVSGDAVGAATPFLNANLPRGVTVVSTEFPIRGGGPAQRDRDMVWFGRSKARIELKYESPFKFPLLSGFLSKTFVIESQSWVREQFKQDFDGSYNGLDQATRERYFKGSNGICDAFATSDSFLGGTLKGFVGMASAGLKTFAESIPGTESYRGAFNGLVDFVSNTVNQVSLLQMAWAMAYVHATLFSEGINGFLRPRMSAAAAWSPCGCSFIMNPFPVLGGANQNLVHVFKHYSSGREEAISSSDYVYDPAFNQIVFKPEFCLANNNGANKLVDFIRDPIGGTMGILQALGNQAWNSLQAVTGDRLGAIASALGGVAGTIGNTGEALQSYLRDNWQEAGVALAAGMDALNAAGKAVGDFFALIWEGLNNIGSLLTTGAVAHARDEAGVTIGNWLRDNWGGVGDAIAGLMEIGGKKAQDFTNWYLDTFKALGEVINGRQQEAFMGYVIRHDLPFLVPKDADPNSDQFKWEKVGHNPSPFVDRNVYDCASLPGDIQQNRASEAAMMGNTVMGVDVSLLELLPSQVPFVTQIEGLLSAIGSKALRPDSCQTNEPFTIDEWVMLILSLPLPGGAALKALVTASKATKFASKGGPLMSWASHIAKKGQDPAEMLKFTPDYKRIYDKTGGYDGLAYGKLLVEKIDPASVLKNMPSPDRYLDALKTGMDRFAGYELPNLGPRDLPPMAAGNAPTMPGLLANTVAPDRLASYIPDVGTKYTADGLQAGVMPKVAPGLEAPPSPLGTMSLPHMDVRPPGDFVPKVTDGFQAGRPLGDVPDFVPKYTALTPPVPAAGSAAGQAATFFDSGKSFGKGIDSARAPPSPDLIPKAPFSDVFASLGKNVDGLGGGGSKLGDNLGAGTGKLGDHVGAGGNKLGDNLGAGGNKLGDNVGAGGSKLGDNVGAGGNKLGDNLGAGGNKLGDNLGAGGNKLGDNLGAGGSKLGDNVGAGGSKLGDNLGAGGNKLGDNLGAGGNKLGDNLGAGGNKLGDNLGAGGNKLGDNLGAGGNKLGDNLGAGGNKLGDNLGAGGNKLGDNLGAGSGKLGDNLGGAGKNPGKLVDDLGKGPIGPGDAGKLPTLNARDIADLLSSKKLGQVEFDRAGMSHVLDSARDLAGPGSKTAIDQMVRLSQPFLRDGRFSGDALDLLVTKLAEHPNFAKLADPKAGALAHLEKMNVLNDVLPNDRVFAILAGKEGLPSGAIEMARRVTPVEMEMLSRKHGVEYALVYEPGKGIQGGGGKYWLIPGEQGMVTIPKSLGDAWYIVSHTHLSGSVFPSAADLKMLRARLDGLGSQGSSTIVPLGKDGLTARFYGDGKVVLEWGKPGKSVTHEGQVSVTLEALKELRASGDWKSMVRIYNPETKRFMEISGDSFLSAGGLPKGAKAADSLLASSDGLGNLKRIIGDLDAAPNDGVPHRFSLADLQTLGDVSKKGHGQLDDWMGKNPEGAKGVNSLEKLVSAVEREGKAGDGMSLVREVGPGGKVRRFEEDGKTVLEAPSEVVGALKMKRALADVDQIVKGADGAGGVLAKSERGKEALSTVYDMARGKRPDDMGVYGRNADNTFKSAQSPQLQGGIFGGAKVVHNNPVLPAANNVVGNLKNAKNAASAGGGNSPGNAAIFNMGKKAQQQAGGNPPANPGKQAANGQNGNTPNGKNGNQANAAGKNPNASANNANGAMPSSGSVRQKGLKGIWQDLQERWKGKGGKEPGELFGARSELEKFTTLDKLLELEKKAPGLLDEIKKVDLPLWNRLQPKLGKPAPGAIGSAQKVLTTVTDHVETVGLVRDVRKFIESDPLQQQRYGHLILKGLENGETMLRRTSEGGIRFKLAMAAEDWRYLGKLIKAAVAAPFHKAADFIAQKFQVPLAAIDRVWTHQFGSAADQMKLVRSQLTRFNEGFGNWSKDHKVLDQQFGEFHKVLETHLGANDAHTLLVHRLHSTLNRRMNDVDGVAGKLSRDELEARKVTEGKRGASYEDVVSYGIDQRNMFGVEGDLIGRSRSALVKNTDRAQIEQKLAGKALSPSDRSTIDQFFAAQNHFDRQGARLHNLTERLAGQAGQMVTAGVRGHFTEVANLVTSGLRRASNEISDFVSPVTAAMREAAYKVVVHLGTEGRQSGHLVNGHNSRVGRISKWQDGQEQEFRDWGTDIRKSAQNLPDNERKARLSELDKIEKNEAANFDMARRTAREWDNKFMLHARNLGIVDNHGKLKIGAFKRIMADARKGKVDPDKIFALEQLIDLETKGLDDVIGDLRRLSPTDATGSLRPDLNRLLSKLDPQTYVRFQERSASVTQRLDGLTDRLVHERDGFHRILEGGLQKKAMAAAEQMVEPFVRVERRLEGVKTALERVPAAFSWFNDHSFKAGWRGIVKHIGSEKRHGEYSEGAVREVIDEGWKAVNESIKALQKEKGVIGRFAKDHTGGKGVYDATKVLQTPRLEKLKQLRSDLALAQQNMTANLKKGGIHAAESSFEQSIVGIRKQITELSQMPGLDPQVVQRALNLPANWVQTRRFNEMTSAWTEAQTKLVKSGAEMDDAVRVTREMAAGGIREQTLGYHFRSSSLKTSKVRDEFSQGRDDLDVALVKNVTTSKDYKRLIDDIVKFKQTPGLSRTDLANLSRAENRVHALEIQNKGAFKGLTKVRQNMSLEMSRMSRTLSVKGASSEGLEVATKRLQGLSREGHNLLGDLNKTLLDDANMTQIDQLLPAGMDRTLLAEVKGRHTDAGSIVDVIETRFGRAGAPNRSLLPGGFVDTVEELGERIVTPFKGVIEEVTALGHDINRAFGRVAHGAVHHFGNVQMRRVGMLGLAKSVERRLKVSDGDWIKLENEEKAFLLRKLGTNTPKQVTDAIESYHGQMMKPTELLPGGKGYPQGITAQVKRALDEGENEPHLLHLVENELTGSNANLTKLRDRAELMTRDPNFANNIYNRLSPADRLAIDQFKARRLSLLDRTGDTLTELVTDRGRVGTPGLREKVVVGADRTADFFYTPVRDMAKDLIRLGEMFEGGARYLGQETMGLTRWVSNNISRQFATEARHSGKIAAVGEKIETIGSTLKGFDEALDKHLIDQIQFATKRMNVLSERKPEEWANLIADFGKLEEKYLDGTVPLDATVLGRLAKEHRAPGKTGIPRDQIVTAFGLYRSQLSARAGKAMIDTKFKKIATEIPTKEKIGRGRSEVGSALDVEDKLSDLSGDLRAFEKAYKDSWNQKGGPGDVLSQAVIPSSGAKLMKRMDELERSWKSTGDMFGTAGRNLDIQGRSIAALTNRGLVSSIERGVRRHFGGADSMREDLAAFKQELGGVLGSVERAFHPSSAQAPKMEDIFNYLHRGHTGSKGPMAISNIPKAELDALADTYKVYPGAVKRLNEISQELSMMGNGMDGSRLSIARQAQRLDRLYAEADRHMSDITDVIDEMTTFTAKHQNNLNLNRVSYDVKGAISEFSQSFGSARGRYAGIAASRKQLAGLSHGGLRPMLARTGQRIAEPFIGIGESVSRGVQGIKREFITQFGSEVSGLKQQAKWYRIVTDTTMKTLIKREGKIGGKMSKVERQLENPNLSAAKRTQLTDELDTLRSQHREVSALLSEHRAAHNVSLAFADQVDSVIAKMEHIGAFKKQLKTDPELKLTSGQMETLFKEMETVFGDVRGRNMVLGLAKKLEGGTAVAPMTVADALARHFKTMGVVDPVGELVTTKFLPKSAGTDAVALLRSPGAKANLPGPDGIALKRVPTSFELEEIETLHGIGMMVMKDPDGKGIRLYRSGDTPPPAAGAPLVVKPPSRLQKATAGVAGVMDYMGKMKTGFARLFERKPKPVKDTIEDWNGPPPLVDYKPGKGPLHDFQWSDLDPYLDPKQVAVLKEVPERLELGPIQKVGAHHLRTLLDLYPEKDYTLMYREGTKDLPGTYVLFSGPHGKIYMPKGKGWYVLNQARMAGKNGRRDKMLLKQLAKAGQVPKEGELKGIPNFMVYEKDAETGISQLMRVEGASRLKLLNWQQWIVRYTVLHGNRTNEARKKVDLINKMKTGQIAAPAP